MTLMPEQGTVKWYNDAKGYGFIVRRHGADVLSTTLNHREGFRTLSEATGCLLKWSKGQKGCRRECLEDFVRSRVDCAARKPLRPLR